MGFYISERRQNLRSEDVEHIMKNMWRTYCRGQNSIGQRQSLQVSHQAVGQESVGRDLRGRSGLDWEKDMSVIQQRDSALNVFIHLLSLMGIYFIFFLFPVFRHNPMVCKRPCPLMLRYWGEWCYFSISKQKTHGDESTHNHQGRAETFLFSLSCSLSWQALMEV